MTVRLLASQFKHTPEIADALDTALAGTLNLQQGKLGKADPYCLTWLDHPLTVGLGIHLLVSVSLRIWATTFRFLR